jgi:hypothetical protein
MDITALKTQIIEEITGEKGVQLTQNWEDDIESLIREVDSLSTFNPISRVSPCTFEPETHTVGTDAITFTSKSLMRFLEGAEACVIMSATLGPRVESKMRILQLTDMAKAYIFDMVCLHYLEMQLDAWEQGYREKLAKRGQYLTQRFSPGYGDLSISVQGDVLSYLDAQKRIGIELTTSNLMIPQKSVTAVLGISTQPFKKTYSRCDACLNRENCDRRGGKHCAFI